MSSIEFPDWYEDTFVDVESMLIDLFSRLLPGVECGCWSADDWLDEPEPHPQLLFFRLPGVRVDYDRFSDVCHVQVAAISPSRDDSWRLIDFVRSVILPMQGFRIEMADGFTATVWVSDDVSGPELLTPEQQIDNRVVTAVFYLRVGLRSRKRYDRFISELQESSILF